MEDILDAQAPHVNTQKGYTLTLTLTLTLTQTLDKVTKQVSYIDCSQLVRTKMQIAALRQAVYSYNITLTGTQKRCGVLSTTTHELLPRGPEYTQETSQ